MEGWSNSIRSVFIPPGMSVSAVIKGYTAEKSVHKSRKVGPLFGPHVFGVVPGDQQWITKYQRWIKDVTPRKWYDYLNPINKIHRREYERALLKMRADWDSLLIKTSKNVLASNRIMLCTEKNMGIQGELFDSSSYCFLLSCLTLRWPYTSISQHHDLFFRDKNINI